MRGIDLRKDGGKGGKSVMDGVEVVRLIKEAADDLEKQKVVERLKELGKVSKELYRWPRLKTEGEAKLVALAEEDEVDGINMWGLLYARLVRLQQESMYPRAVKTMELVGAIMAWEDKWKQK